MYIKTTDKELLNAHFSQFKGLHHPLLDKFYECWDRGEDVSFTYCGIRRTMKAKWSGPEMPEWLKGYAVIKT